jgi:hypothetical protein
MSYIITKSDGTILTELVDGTTDQVHSSLTLVAKSASAYGTALNQNFVYLLENFANSVQPRSPTVGQLWFDTTQNRLKVYDGVNFKVSGGTIVSASSPSGINAGDIWIDSARQQLYFNDGTSTKLAGPVYTATQGISGFITEDIVDSIGISHTVLSLYVAQTLIGIFSKDNFIEKPYYIYNKKTFYELYKDFDYEFYKNKYFKDTDKNEFDILLTLFCIFS